MSGLIIFGLLIFHSKSEFQAAFNHYAVHTYGSTSSNAYADTIAKGTYPHAGSLAGVAFGSTLLLIPMIAFFNLWSNWGATLYGEVRGASDFRKNIYAMGGALVFMTVITVITLGAMAHSVGLDFYGRELHALGEQVPRDRERRVRAPSASAARSSHR